MSKLNNKVALVTGAAGSGAGGTGRSIAEKLAENGAKVVIVDLNEEVGKLTSDTMNEQGYDTIFIKCDIANENEVKNAIEETIKHYKKLDILVNNAYLYDANPVKIADFPVDEWDRQFAVNLRGHFLFTKFAIPELIKNDSSSIINISSVSSIAPEDKGAAYGACKAALNSLTGFTATQYGRDGLRCNAILPGLILSDDMEASIKTNQEMQAFFSVYDQNILINRHGNGRDVANLVSFLVSDEAAYITGAKYVLDGGMSAHASELATMRALTGE